MSSLAVILVFCAAVAAAFFFRPSQSVSTSETTMRVDPGPQPIPTTYVSNLGGTVLSVGESSIKISSAIPGKSDPIVSTVVIESDTSVYMQVRKDDSTIQKEQDAYRAHPSGEPPLPFTPKKVALSDLASGMIVSIKLAEPSDSDSSLRAISVGVLQL